MTQTESPHTSIWPSAYDLDAIHAVPLPLRLRTIHALALSIAVISLAAALQWPQSWRLVTLGDLAAMSVLSALAAGREWSLRNWRHHCLAETRIAVPAHIAGRPDRFRFRAVLLQPGLRNRFAAVAFITFLAVSAATLMQRFAELNRDRAVQSVELSRPRDGG